MRPLLPLSSGAPHVAVSFQLTTNSLSRRLRRCFGRILSLALATLTLGALPSANWTALAVGMDRPTTIKILGEPLFHTQSRLFSTWIYDHRAEVVFYRENVLGWTPPQISPIAPALEPQSPQKPAGESAKPPPRSQTPR